MMPSFLSARSFRWAACCVLLLLSGWMLSACKEEKPKPDPQRVAIHEALHAFYVDGMGKGDLVTAHFATTYARNESRKDFKVERLSEGDGKGGPGMGAIYRAMQKKIEENGGIEEIEIVEFHPAKRKDAEDFKVNIDSVYDRVTYRVHYKNGKSFLDSKRTFIRVVLKDEGNVFSMPDYKDALYYPDGDLYKIDPYGMQNMKLEETVQTKQP